MLPLINKSIYINIRSVSLSILIGFASLVAAIPSAQAYWDPAWGPCPYEEWECVMLYNDPNSTWAPAPPQTPIPTTFTYNPFSPNGPTNNNGGASPPLSQTISEAEAKRQATCNAAKAEAQRLICSIRSTSMPLTHQEMTFGLSGLYTQMRPIALQFHQNLWNDFTDITWQNFSGVYDQMHTTCNALAGIYPVVDGVAIALCRDRINDYFNQGIAARLFGLRPYDLFLQSPAAADFRSSLYGQACANNAQVQRENLCG